MSYSWNIFIWYVISIFSGSPHWCGEQGSRLCDSQWSWNLHQNYPKTKLDSKTCYNRLLQIMMMFYPHFLQSIYISTGSSYLWLCWTGSNWLMSCLGRDTRILHWISTYTVKLGLIRNKLVLTNHFLWPIDNLLYKCKEHFTSKNNFRVTKKFLITKFDCTI